MQVPTRPGQPSDDIPLGVGVSDGARRAEPGREQAHWPARLLRNLDEGDVNALCDRNIVRPVVCEFLRRAEVENALEAILPHLFRLQGSCVVMMILRYKETGA